MHYLILSDIHGNREALEAVLDHAQMHAAGTAKELKGHARQKANN